MNPWNKQRELMRMSGQRIPPGPEVNADTLLYLALMLEETAEALTTVSRVLVDHEPVSMSDVCAVAAVVALRHSQRLRELVVTMNQRDMRVPLTASDMKSLLDDASDMAVVVMGFAVASGLPGAEGYAMVQESNASKANPSTGMIDKTPDGKWIKGPNYEPPNMDELIERVLLAARSTC